MIWRRSSRCEAYNCVEVAITDQVHVRDAAGRTITVDREAWRAFLHLIK